MLLVHSKDRSILWTCFLMKVVGLWIAANKAEQFRRNFALIYTFFALITAASIAARDMYFSWGNFIECIYIFSNILYLMLGVFKMTVLYVQRQKFHDLVMSTERSMISLSNDREEQMILKDCKRLCDIFTVFTALCAQFSCIGYAITPIFENIGKNESDRILPFNLWVDLPTSTSPYFEALFIIQMLCVYHVAVSYLCFDVFLCIVSLNITGQFRILQYRLARLNNIMEDRMYGEDLDASLTKKAINYRVQLHNCIRQHQKLINYCRKLENVFTLIVLGVVIFLAVLLCILGFQIFLLVLPPIRRVGSIMAMLVVCSELAMFTYCWDGLIRESVNVGQAVFSGPWCTLPMNRIGKVLRYDVFMIIMRSRKCCCLTAGGFFPVSLETFTAVLSTAMSYFTLLRQSTADLLKT